MLAILEHLYVSTKKEILDNLATYAPAELKSKIEALEKEWSALW